MASTINRRGKNEGAKGLLNSAPKQRCSQHSFVCLALCHGPPQSCVTTAWLAGSQCAPNRGQRLGPHAHRRRFLAGFCFLGGGFLGGLVPDAGQPLALLRERSASGGCAMAKGDARYVPPLLPFSAKHGSSMCGCPFPNPASCHCRQVQHHPRSSGAHNGLSPQPPPHLPPWPVIEPMPVVAVAQHDGAPKRPRRHVLDHLSQGCRRGAQLSPAP